MNNNDNRQGPQEFLGTETTIRQYFFSIYLFFYEAQAAFAIYAVCLQSEI